MLRFRDLRVWFLLCSVTEGAAVAWKEMACGPDGKPCFVLSAADSLLLLLGFLNSQTGSRGEGIGWTYET